MKIRIVLNEKRVFEFEDSQIKDGKMPAILSRSFERYSYFSARYIIEEDLLEIYYGANMTRLTVLPEGWLNLKIEEEVLD